MYSQRGAAQYRSVRSHGLVAEASPARLVQIMFEQILAHLATAQGCMGRIDNNLPLSDVIAKGNAIAENLRALYVYMLARLTQANVTNDSSLVAEVASLVQKVKTGWDQIVEPR
jgi:flagellar secretion chaperone FliS